MMNARKLRYAFFSFLLIGCGLNLGCIGRSAISLPDLPLPLTSLASITMSPVNAIVAVGGTQQLSVTGITLAGGAVTTFDSVVYQFDAAGDSLKFLLSSSGLVTANKAISGIVKVDAFAFLAGTLRGDQTIVQITPAVIPGLVLSMQPVVPDSTKLAVGTTKIVTATLRNPTTGASVTNPTLRYTTRDSTRVAVYQSILKYFFNTSDFLYANQAGNLSRSLSPNQITPVTGEGTAWLYGAVSAYGTLLQDSVRYTFSYPFSRTISTVKASLAIDNTYNGQTLTLAPGAVVTFQNGVAATDPLTITYTFDNPALAAAATTGGASGNTTALTGTQTTTRKFLTAGTTVRWTATAAGGPAPWPGQAISGTIMIK